MKNSKPFFSIKIVYKRDPLCVELRYFKSPIEAELWLDDIVRLLGIDCIDYAYILRKN